MSEVRLSEETGFRSPVVQAAWDYWYRVRGDRPMPARADILPEDLVKVAPNMMLLDVFEGPLDFGYRLIGTRVEEFMSDRYTGRRMSEIPHQAPPSKVFSDCEACIDARAPFLSSAPYVGPHKDLVTPEALILPLSEDGTRVNMLWVVIDYFGRGETKRRLPGSI